MSLPRRQRFDRDLVRRVANLVVIPLAIAYIWLSRTGEETGAVARATEPVFAAAGWAFAIWGLIFLGQLAYVIYQATPSQAHRALHRRIGALTVVNSLLAAAWTWTFGHGQFTLAWILMIASVVVLVALDLRIRAEGLRGRDIALVRAPYGINLGWIIAAFLLDTAQFLHAVASYDGAPLSPVGFAILLTLVAGALGLYLVLGRQNPFAGLAIAWALAGVAAYHDELRTLTLSAAVLAIAIGALAVWQLADRGHHGLPRPWRRA
jgi:hypothetical protein